MDATPARMSKGLFGFRAKDVQKMLADREAMLRLAQQQSQEVRARADQIQAELGRLHEEIAGRDRNIEVLREEVRHRDGSLTSLRGELAQIQVQTESRIAELTEQSRQLQQQLQEQVRARDSQQILMDELAPILRAAQESAQRIVERAEEAGELRTREAERMRADMSGAISQYVRWRQRLETIMTSVQDRLDEAQSRISEVPKRIQEALSPMSDAIYLFNEDLTTLSQVGEPPGHVAPPPPAPQTSDRPAERASAEERVVIPEAVGQQPAGAQGAGPSTMSPLPGPDPREPEGIDPSLRPPDERTAGGSGLTRDVGDSVEGDDSTEVWTRTGWS
jgi:hypothetical protein